MSNTEPQIGISTERFSVSASGMRSLNIGRKPWDLVKELIQNAWDEAPFATECRVIVKPHPEGNTTTVTVQDDGPGFSNIADAYTIMGNTSKRLHPTKRGRFNIGEKDVISVATEAEVETVGYTVVFPRSGSREITPNSRKKGTQIQVLMPWNERQSKELVAMLQRFRAPLNCRLFVNDLEVLPRPAKKIRSAELQTEVQDDPNGPMRTIRRRTEIHLVEPADSDGERWVYEMGIPVQVIGCPWHIDVMQKIPLDQKRNVISDTFLNRIYAETLNASHRDLKKEEFASDWVKRAIENSQIDSEAIKSTAIGRYGLKAVFSTIDRNADMRATEAGYELISPSSLSTRERELFRKYAGIQDSSEKFPTPPPPLNDYLPEPGSDQARFAEWVTEMASHCNLTATVRYFHEPGNDRLADCSVSTTTPTIRFNEAHLTRLTPTFFQPPYESIDHWDLLFHELGHALADPPSSVHGEAWGDGVSKAGALIALRLLQDRNR